MKVLIFIEREEDYQAAKGYLPSNPSAGGETVVVNLNSSLTFDFSKFPQIRYQTEEEYLQHLSLESLNHQALKDGRAILHHPALLKYWDYEGVNMGVMIEHALVRAVTTVYKYIALIRHIIESEGSHEVVVFYEEDENHHKDIRFSENDRLAKKVTSVLSGVGGLNKKIKVIAIALPHSKMTALENKTKSEFYFLRYLSRYFRRFLNLTLRILPSQKETILVCGHPGKTFPIIEEIIHLRQQRIVYFQQKTAPRLLSWLWSHRIEYQTLEDYSDADQNTEARDETQEFIKLLQKNRLFTYENLDLTSIYEEKFNVLFKKLMPVYKSKIRRFRGLMQRTHCKVVMIDEDISYFNRALILTAQSLGIKCAEFQHGAVTKYFLHLEVADKKLVWGDYFKNRILEETEIPASKIAVVGPVHLEHLACNNKPEQRSRDREYILKTLGIPETSRIVLYAPHGIHKSSKGGVLNHHNTRSIAETTLEEVIQAVKGRVNLHLIIKLHHADHKPLFYKQFIDERNASLPYSVVRFLSFYKLVNACDVLITPVSTTLFEAIVLGQPVILTNYEKRKLVFSNVDQALPCVEDKGQLKVALDNLMNFPDQYWSRFTPGREIVKKEFLSGVDGRSGHRLRLELRELLRS